MPTPKTPTPTPQTPAPPPHLDAAMAHLEELNRFTTHRALRAFQRTMLEQARLELISPMSGQSVAASACYLHPNGGALYWFEEAGHAPFLLLVSVLHRGYPALGFITAAGVVPAQADPGGALAEHGKKMMRLGRRPPQMLSGKGRANLCLGHPNFAHFMWNEFPALYAARDLGGAFTLQGFFDSLGVLETFCETHAIPLHMKNRPNAMRGWQARLCVCAGAEFCDAQAKGALLELCGLTQAKSGSATGPVFYVTLRDKGRTLQDQAAVLGHLLRALLERFEGSRVLLDGFSRPDDDGRVIYKTWRAGFQARIEGGRALARAITAALPPAMAGRVDDLTGMGLRQALGAIAACDYYVAHAGTTQHKVGWFFDRPGTMHGNLASIGGGAPQWVAAQVADSRAPRVPDTAQIIDGAVEGMPRDTARNRDYALRDPDRVIGDILEHAAATLAGQN